jgi:hypothetical protein
VGSPARIPDCAGLGDVRPHRAPPRGTLELCETRRGAEPDSRQRADYAAIALLFAERAGRKALWDDKLKGWNVTESAYINEFIAKGEAKGRAEGEARGEARGRAEEARSLVLRLGAKRFGPPQAAVEATVLAISDRERLERISERILDAANWNDLLATP